MLRPAQKHIEEGRWWDEPWGIVNGCAPVSDGCEHCWSASIAHRFHQGLTNEAGAFSGEVRFREDLLDVPLRRKRPTVYAVWNDLFHEGVSADDIITAFEYMGGDTQGRGKQHLYFVLTKRPHRVASVLYGEEGQWYLGGGDYIPNVWLGTTVENQAAADLRIPHLGDWWPFKRFLSVEPLLGPVTLKLDDIDWVIVGGESGPGARRCDPEWIRDVVRQCREQQTPAWVKQLGSVWAKGTAGSKGQWMTAWPKDLQVREWPE